MIILKNDSLVKGTFFRNDGKIRYEYLYFEKDYFVMKDYTNKGKKIYVSKGEMWAWILLY